MSTYLGQMLSKHGQELCEVDPLLSVRVVGEGRLHKAINGGTIGSLPKIGEHGLDVVAGDKSIAICVDGIEGFAQAGDLLAAERVVYARRLPRVGGSLVTCAGVRLSVCLCGR